MQISVPYSSEDLPILPDVLARLNVLYPNLEIVDEKGVLTISGIDASLAETVRQAGLDQLIRSRFDARSVSLRENLYKKLLG